jgi:hypothetical protein
MRNYLLLFAVCIVLLGCTDDRSGHAIGYRWADKKQITESSECPLGNSDSEGCLDRYRRADQDDDGKPIDGPRSSAK